MVVSEGPLAGSAGATALMRRWSVSPGAGVPGKKMHARGSPGMAFVQILSGLFHAPMVKPLRVA
jgi:hypothetical protein